MRRAGSKKDAAACSHCDWQFKLPVAQWPRGTQRGTVTGPRARGPAGTKRPKPEPPGCQCLRLGLGRPGPTEAPSGRAPHWQCQRRPWRAWAPAGPTVPRRAAACPQPLSSCGDRRGDGGRGPGRRAWPRPPATEAGPVGCKGASATTPPAGGHAAFCGAYTDLLDPRPALRGALC